MKKLFSTFLALVLLISVMVPVTGALSVSADNSIVADIDFSETYYDTNSKVMKYNGFYGETLCFTRVSVATASTWGDAILHAIGDDNGELRLPIGSRLRVSFDICREILLPEQATHDFMVGILYLTDEEKTAAEGKGGLIKYVDRIQKIASSDNVADNEWERLEGTITVPEYADGAKAYIVLYSDYQTSNDITRTKIWIDNINFALLPNAIDDVDFSEAYYTNNNKVMQYNIFYGKALCFTRVSHVSADWANAILHAIGDDNGELKLPAGSELDVSLDICREILLPEQATDDFMVGILFLTDEEKIAVEDKGGLLKYADRIQKIALSDNTADNEWEKLTGTITVPEYSSDAKAYMVLYGGYQTSNDIAKTKIWVDNIEFAKAPVAVNDIDFSEEYYSNNNKVMEYNGYGKALCFTRVSHVTADWGYARLQAIGDDNGELQHPVGSELNVSLDICREILLPEQATSNFMVGILYLTDEEKTAVVEAGGLFKYANRIQKIAYSDNAANNEWERLEGTITVPEYADDAKAYMVLYSDYQTSDDINKTKIWVDNIAFASYSAERATTVGDFTGEGDIDANDVVSMRKSLLGCMEYDVYVANINADNEVNILDLIAIKKLTVK